MASRAVLVLRAGAALVVVSVLSACSGFGPTHSHVSSAVTGHFKGLPKGVVISPSQQTADAQQPWSTWAAPSAIYVMTWGSGSCPRIPTSVNAGDANHVVITTLEHDFHEGDDACTADLSVTTSVVRLPSGVDITRPLVVEIDGTNTHLAARTS